MPEKSHSQVPTLENPRGTTPARQAPTRLKSASSRRRMQRGQGGEGKNTRARCRSIDDSPHGWASTQREDSPNLAHPSFRKRVTSMNERDGLGWPAQRVEPRFIHPTTAPGPLSSHERNRMCEARGATLPKETTMGKLAYQTANRTPTIQRDAKRWKHTKRDEREHDTQKCTDGFEGGCQGRQTMPKGAHRSSITPPPRSDASRRPPKACNSVIADPLHRRPPELHYWQ